MEILGTQWELNSYTKQCLEGILRSMLGTELESITGKASALTPGLSLWTLY